MPGGSGGRAPRRVLAQLTTSNRDDLSNTVRAGTHGVAQLPLQQGRDELGQKIDEHQGLNALGLFQEDGGDLWDGCQQAMARFQVGWSLARGAYAQGIKARVPMSAGRCRAGPSCP